MSLYPPDGDITYGWKSFGRSFTLAGIVALGVSSLAFCARENLLPIHLTAADSLFAYALSWIGLAFFALMLLCGLGATAYLALKARLARGLVRVPLLWRGLLAGLGLGLLALPGHFLWHDLPITQGGGLDLVEALLQGRTLPASAAWFLALKMAATALTFAGGGIGGLWLPSLAMGAAMGTAFDGYLHLGTQGYLTLVGASAMAGATHASLLVPVVLMAETTGQAALVVPALVATTVSYLVVRERN